MIKMAFKQIAVLLSVLVLTCYAERSIKFKSCDRDAPMQLNSLTLGSYPLKIKPGVRITAYGSFRNSYSANSNERFTLRIKHVCKSVGWLGCAPFTAVIPSSFRNIPIQCGQIPGCPAKQGTQTFKIDEVLPINLPIPSAVKIFDGKFKGKGTLEDSRGRVVACVELTDYLEIDL